ncbi:MAG: hypothetical protein ACOVQ7_18810 [Limnoraphis robusta]
MWISSQEASQGLVLVVSILDRASIMRSHLFLYCLGNHFYAIASA